MGRHWVWTEHEDDKLRRLYGTATYSEIAKRFKGRTSHAIRWRARFLGLTPRRHIWTGADIVRLRRLYRHATPTEVCAAFPGLSWIQIRQAARYHGLTRPRRKYVSTGVDALDEIRLRAFELGYSMSDVDKLARSKKYFERAGWLSGHINYAAIGRAVAALDGTITATWR